MMGVAHGYHLPICGSHAYTACKSFSYVKLPPALVSLSFFCIFPKYAACCWTALTLLALAGGLVPTTGLGLAHGGVTGWVIRRVMVGLEWGCCRSDLSLWRELRPGWWLWTMAVGCPIWGCEWWFGGGCVGGGNLCLSLPYSWSAKALSLPLSDAEIWWRGREGCWPLHALGLVELILPLPAPVLLLSSPLWPVKLSREWVLLWLCMGGQGFPLSYWGWRWRKHGETCERRWALSVLFVWVPLVATSEERCNALACVQMRVFRMERVRQVS